MRRLAMPERWQQELRKLKSLEPPDGLWDRATLGARREPPRAHRTWRGTAPLAAPLSREGGGGSAPPPLRDRACPLSPSSFSRTRPYVGGTEPHPWYRGLYGDGFSFNAAVWIGPHASRAERHAAWAVVRSLRFPALRESTIWHGPYYVLGRASRYPTGSGTTLPAPSLPSTYSLPASPPQAFFLIH